ncbi:type II toxin-antitoxin system RelE/ParE family toxin [Roseomonas sp. E05]|uniref:type II toxin-antitoxin system RelE/ParE family toxin n=1 Tax=Roseomonas sp. E05 TaxID=3046310 RepID=UPI0024BAF698|nr:type II toxin-antitoxin system RelE/ParE family toxin [Roseomonas sp. E05]MDJ0388041.1 type II toxin-antitoxin system RelE/ParE family toxin [Roseomonas sp. E05]
MAMLVWLPEAVADLDRLLSALRARSPEAARRAAQTVLRVTRRLAEDVMLGRPLADGTGRRELLVPLAGIGLMVRYGLDEAGRVALIRIGQGREEWA